MRWLVALALVACDNAGSTPDWSRMIDQPKLAPYRATELFSDGRAMRPVPAGAVARDAVTGTTPPPVTRALLERGRERFAIACAACHGLAGDGDAAVARAMQRRRPPSLYEPRLVALPAADLYRVITIGYGLMPSYAALLRSPDRWAVVAYVRTLQLSQAAQLDRLPEAERTAALQRLP